MEAASTPVPPARITSLDTMRGLAALGIVVFHVTYSTGLALQPTWGGWLNRLEAGVNVFFVISGFVLFRPYALAAATGATWPRPGRYALRRFLRIVPAFWLLVVVDFLTLVRPTPDALTWLRHLTFTAYYVPGPLLPGVSVAWTLTVEVVFYALLPFVAFALLRRFPYGGQPRPRYRQWRPVRDVAILLVVGLAISVSWLSQLWPGPLNPYVHALWFPSFAMAFATGMAMAAVSVARHTRTGPRWWRLLDELGSYPWACWGLAFVLYGMSVYVAGPLGGVGVPTGTEYLVKELLYLGFATLLLLPVVFGDNRLGWLLGRRPLIWLGTVSLGLFLWHLTVIEVIARLTGPPWGKDATPLLLVITAISLVLAAASWYGVERPALRLADRLLSRAPFRPSRAEGAGSVRSMTDSSKHPPRVDEDLQRRSQGHLDGAPPGGRAQEWREPEPPAEGEPEVSATPHADSLSRSDVELELSPEELQARSRFGRYFARTSFPARRDQLLHDARQAQAPDDILEALSRLPAHQIFENATRAWAALGHPIGQRF